MKPKLLPALLLLSLVIGCSSTPSSLTSPGQAQHVVIVWLKPDGSRDAVLQSAGQIRQIPGVIDVSVGNKLASDRPVVDSSYDVMLVVTFDDERSLRAYDQHPIHKQLVEAVIKPNVAKFVVYDSLIQSYAWGQDVDEDIAARRAKASKLQDDVVNRRQ